MVFNIFKGVEHLRISFQIKFWSLNELLPSDRMKMNAHLFVRPEFDNEIVQKSAVDIVVQILDRYFNFGRITNIVFVNLR